MPFSILVLLKQLQVLKLQLFLFKDLHCCLPVQQIVLCLIVISFACTIIYPIPVKHLLILQMPSIVILVTMILPAPLDK